MPDGIYVPFTSDNFELHAQPAADVCHNISHKQQARTALQIHAALCHAGRNWVQSSRIAIDGEPVTRFPATELCTGCALSGIRREHREGVTTRRDRPKDNKEQALFYGQCIHSDTCTGFPKSFPHGFTGMLKFCDEYSGD